MLTRTEILLSSVPRSTRIIEIGPGSNPIAPKSEGWNSASLDHLNREGLMEKYKAHPEIDVSRIEPVDFVWTGGALSDAVPAQQHGTFDLLLASHVIEHTPDLVAFLDSAATLLSPDGATVLVVPDKRYCFDYFQSLTTTGELLEAHAQHRFRHTRRQAFDHLAYGVTDGGIGAWGQHPIQGIRLIHDLENPLDAFRTINDQTGYTDLHAWCFVPSSFELLLLELACLGQTDWRVDRITSAAGPEFIVWLLRGGRAHVGSLSAAEISAQRVALLKHVLLEVQAQADWLLASEPELINGQPLDPVTALGRTRHENANLRDRLALVEAQHAAALQKLAAFESSTSWRITAPLRRVIDGVRRTNVNGTQPAARN